MNALITTLLSIFMMASTLFGGLPKIEKRKDQEKLVVTVTYSEPAIRTYEYSFSGKDVRIKESGKELGRLTLTDEEIKKVDQYLDMVRRGKKATRSHLGAPYYNIDHFKSGKKADTWTFNISDARESTKPNLPLFELKKRLEEK